MFLFIGLGALILDSKAFWAERGSAGSVTIFRWPYFVIGVSSKVSEAKDDISDSSPND